MTKEVFQLEVQVNTNPALTGLNALDKKLKDVKDSADRIGKSGNFSGLTTQVNGLTGAFSGLGSVLSGLAIGKIATDAVTAIAAFETLQTVLGTVAGGITQAADAMKLLRDVSSSTPFTINELGTTFIKLKSAGIEPTAEKLRLFADVASVTTDKMGALTAISDLYARTTAGGLGLEELNRLAERGIPVYDILGKKLGVNRLQISELGKTAEGAQIILRNLESALSDQFGGAAAKNMNTLNGQFDILKKNITNLYVGVGNAGLNDGLKSLLGVLNQAAVDSNGLASTVGGVLGDALKGLASTIAFIGRNWEILISIVLVGFTAWRVGITGIITAFNVLRGAVASIGGFFKNIYYSIKEISLAGSTVFEEIIYFGKSIGAAFQGLSPVAAIFKGIGNAAVFVNSILAKLLTQLGANILYATGLFALIEKGQNLYKDIFGDSKPATNTPDVAGSRRDFRKMENSDAESSRNADRQRTNELLTGRDAIISKIVSNINKETAAIGLTKQKAEETTKILEAQAQIKEKLMAGGTMTEAAADKESARLVNEKAGAIRLAIAEKYSKELQYQMKLMRDNTSFEVSLLGQSSNEIEKQTKLRETLLSLGIKDTATTQQKKDILEQITLLQEGRITDSLSKNLKGIQLETEYLKLGNEERERRIALDKAAADAGFKDAQELINKRPAEAARISSAIGTKVQTGIDVAGRDQIRDLKEESALLTILNDKDREREKKKNDIYKAIDPEGRGKKINEMQRNEIDALLKTIEAQEQLLEVNKKIDDAFATLGDAASNWALGTEGSIKRVRLALLQLATLAAFKYFAGGVPTGASGSFLSGVLGGLSGARAEGGPVDAGKSYLVGEKRPEVFVPSTNGYIVPNTAMMNTSTGATHVTLSPNLIIQGSVTGQTELENMFDQFSSAMANETQKFVITQLGQNGILAR